MSAPQPAPEPDLTDHHLITCLREAPLAFRADHPSVASVKIEHLMEYLDYLMVEEKRRGKPITLSDLKMLLR